MHPTPWGCALAAGFIGVLLSGAVVTESVLGRAGGLGEVYRLEESQQPDAEGSLNSQDAQQAVEPQPTNPNPAPTTTRSQDQGGEVAAGTPAPPVNGGGSEGGEIIKKPLPGSPPTAAPPPIPSPYPAPPAPNPEYHAQAGHHLKTREVDRDTMTNNQAAGLDHGSTDDGTRWPQSQAGNYNDPKDASPASIQGREDDKSEADVVRTQPQQTPPDPDAYPAPDPLTTQAWVRATGSAYSSDDRDSRGEVMAPTDGRVPIVNIDPTNKLYPYKNEREYPYPPAPPDGSAMQNYIWQTTTAHEADTWKPVYPDVDPHATLDSDQDLNGENGLAVYRPAPRDNKGREAASEPIVYEEGSRQYVAPAEKPDAPEPPLPAVPADVVANITRHAQEWLKQEEIDIDNNPENDGGKKFAEIAVKSKESRAKVAESEVKGRIKEWQEEKATKSRNARERNKKADLLASMKARAQFERQEKINVTSVERASKKLLAHQTEELTLKERAMKPSELQQKDLDRAAGSAKMAEANQKYKEYDIVQETAEKAELKREDAALKERHAKHDALEAEAGNGTSLAEAMGRDQHDFMDILAKDAYIASLKDKAHSKKASGNEQKVAVRFEELSQSAELPTMRPGAMAGTGVAGAIEELD